MSASQGIADRLTVDVDLVAERDRKIGDHLANRHGYSVESLRMPRRRRRPEDVVLNGYPVTDLPLERDEPRELIRSVAQAVAPQPQREDKVRAAVDYASQLTEALDRTEPDHGG